VDVAHSPEGGTLAIPSRLEATLVLHRTPRDRPQEDDPILGMIFTKLLEE
jgi:hypothetical protein